MPQTGPRAQDSPPSPCRRRHRSVPRAPALQTRLGVWDQHEGMAPWPLLPPSSAPPHAHPLHLGFPPLGFTGGGGGGQPSLTHESSCQPRLRGVSCSSALLDPFYLPLHPTLRTPLSAPVVFPSRPITAPGRPAHLHPALPLPGQPGPAVHLPAVGAAEVVWVVGIILEHEGLLVDDQVAALTDVLAQALGLLTVVAGSAQVPVRSEVGVRGRATLPARAAWATSLEKTPPAPARSLNERLPGSVRGLSSVVQKSKPTVLWPGRPRVHPLKGASARGKDQEETQQHAVFGQYGKCGVFLLYAFSEPRTSCVDESRHFMGIC